MNNVVGVRFKENGKIYFFKSNNIDIKENDKVIVETDKGLQLGIVISPNINNKEVNNNMKNIVRIASKKDIDTYEINKIDAFEALNKAREIAEELELEMNFLEANYTFERNQLIFLFTADGRVDFRELAKQLAAIYKTRIELRQIGIRDKAKEISGLGQCGRELCCASFLKDSMESVSITMAKNQNISLNPTKINGQCGRLLCCLKYEDDVYTEYKKDMPNVGDKVKTEKGNGIVSSVDILKRSYVVDVEDEGKIEVTL